MNDLRVSDRDREAVMARLGAAAGEGRLTFAEFDHRSGQAYAAKTYRELEALVADLPSTERDLPSAERDHRSPVIDYTGLALALLALAGGVVWMPLFPHLEFAALTGAVGVVFGLFDACKRSRSLPCSGSLGTCRRLSWRCTASRLDRLLRADVRKGLDLVMRRLPRALTKWLARRSRHPSRQSRASHGPVTVASSGHERARDAFQRAGSRRRFGHHDRLSTLL